MCLSSGDITVYAEVLKQYIKKFSITNKRVHLRIQAEPKISFHCYVTIICENIFLKFIYEHSKENEIL